MYEEPEPMREIHRIREKFYEETKHLSGKELIAKVHKEAQEAIEKYGLKFKKHSHAT